MKTKVLLGFLFFALVTTVGLTSCKEDPDGFWEQMEWVPDFGKETFHRISVPVEGGTYKYVCTNYSIWITSFRINGEFITPEDLEHDIKEDANRVPMGELSGEWFAASYKSSHEQGVLNVTISPNDSGEGRTCGIEVSAGDVSNHFSFEQKGQ